MITGFKRTTPGVNGGISLLGEGTALLGSFIIGLSYVIPIPTDFMLFTRSTIGFIPLESFKRFSTPLPRNIKFTVAPKIWIIQ